MSVVLDTSAVLAALWGEAGAAQVEPHLPGATISAVNLAELIAKLIDRGADPGQVDAVLDGLGLVVQPFDAAQARTAGDLRRKTRAAGLALADRACLALAATLGQPVLTADRVWGGLDVGTDVHLIR